MTKAWLNDPLVEKTLSKPSVIEGLLEVLFAAINEEIQELVISLLTEFVTRNEANGKIILSLDPQLEGFTTLMRNSSLFLKAASLLHLVKPEAKQMMSTEWIPLVLRVLEFGDQTQTLFSVRCSPQIAAYYFLDQLLTGFDEDRNLENGRQVISLGGLSLLLRRMVIGDTVEKTKAASVIYLCIQADGRCRHYLADNLNPELILSLLVDARELDSDEITGDPLKSSVYREESIEAITEALDSQICNENVQKEAAKALLILGGRYGYTGTPEIEKWILKEAGYDESLEGGFHGRYHVAKGSKHLDEIEHWQRKAAMGLWISGGEKLIAALGESIANGIPCLARSSLVTVAWMSKFVHTVGDGDVLWSTTLLTMVRQFDVRALRRRKESDGGSASTHIKGDMDCKETNFHHSRKSNNKIFRPLTKACWFNHHH
ncbi:Armadillo-like helical [Cynara cardunculus var. scolymus]|uniref:Armadillo-like helical n=1 Tax=Cynara cardunculus var. scolymus TaxID=59895 RepID=A0A103XBL8_CYNCS|nr:Armadillo-like helical [Cynara cardunculus var. scolymus]